MGTTNTKPASLARATFSSRQFGKEELDLARAMVVKRGGGAKTKYVAVDEERKDLVSCGKIFEAGDTDLHLGEFKDRNPVF